MITVTNEETCRGLWGHLDPSPSYGISASFDFRRYYSSRSGMQPYFLCDDERDPSFVVPLCTARDRLDWFGTSELEDSRLYCRPDAGEKLLQSLGVVGVRQMPNVRGEQVERLRELSLVESVAVTGVKVVAGAEGLKPGGAHWSARNLARTTRAFDALKPEWVLHEDPKLSEIENVLDESVLWFASRDRTSKFQSEEKRKKYADIYTSRVPGVRALMAECIAGGSSAIRALALVSDRTATVSTVAVNTEHPSGKAVPQYGFRYAISSLPTALSESVGTEWVDYQGGDHSWKKEVSPECQITQYKVTLGHELR